MKKIIIVLCLIIASVSGFAQVDLIEPQFSGSCGVSNSQIVNYYTSAQINKQRNTVTDPNRVFNVKVHYINNNVPVHEQEAKTLDIVGVLNLEFNAGNIYFKYAGFDNIPNLSFLALSVTNIGNLYPADKDFIDIFICDSFVGQTNTLGVTYSWNYTISGEVQRKCIALRKDYIPTLNVQNPNNAELKNNTLTHEMGHYLGLYHTHQPWKC